MGKFFALGAVELGLSRLAQNLGQGLYHLGGRKGDGQVLELVVVHGHDDKVQIVELPALHLIKALFCEHLGEFDLPLTPAAAEDHGISVGNFADGFSVLHQNHGFQVVVILAQFIRFFDGLRQLCAAALHFRHIKSLPILKKMSERNAGDRSAESHPLVPRLFPAQSHCPSLGRISFSTATLPRSGKISSSWGKV